MDRKNDEFPKQHNDLTSVRPNVAATAAPTAWEYVRLVAVVVANGERNTWRNRKIKMTDKLSQLTLIII